MQLSLMDGKDYNMSKKISRFEVFPDEVFVNIEVNDDLGFYNFGRWLSPKDAEEVKADMATKKVSATTYMTRKTSVLNSWANSKLAEARVCKLEDIEAGKRIDTDAEFGDKIVGG